MFKTKNTHFRAWKSGKSWLYASSVLAVLAGGATLGTVTSKAAQINTNPITQELTTGTENTATGDLGDDAVAGSDNVSSANATRGALLTDNGGSVANVGTNTNGTHAANDSSLPQGTQLANGSTVPGTVASATVVGGSGAAILNSNGAITAGSSASSSVSFDVGQVDSVSPSFAILQGGSYVWTISAPSDLAKAGLGVAGINVTYSATQMADNGSGTSSIVVNSNTAIAQTAGGTYITLNQNAGSYLPGDTTIQSNFVLTASAASENASNAATAASLTAENAALNAALQSAQSAYDVAMATSGFSGSAASLASQMVVIKASLASNAATIAILSNTQNLSGYVSSMVTNSEALVSVQYTANSGLIDVLQSVFAGIVGGSTGLVTAAVGAIGDGISDASKGIQQILNGNVLAGVLNDIHAGWGDVLYKALGNSLSLNGIINLGAAGLADLLAANGIMGGLESLVGINPSSLANGIMNVATGIQTAINGISSGFQQYAQNVTANVDAINSATKQLWDAINSMSGAFTLNYLAPVTSNGDGTFTVDGGSASFAEAITNFISTIVNNYITTVQAAINGLLSLPTSLTHIDLGIPSTGGVFGQVLGGLINGVTNLLSGVFQAYNGILHGAVNGISTGLTDLSNDLSQGIGSFGSYLLNASPSARASVTVGFTAQDPTQEIKQNLADSGLTTPIQQNNQYVAETFAVTPQVQNGSTFTNGAGYTTVVYQLQEKLPATINMTAKDVTVWQNTDYNPLSNITSIENSDGSEGDINGITVSGWSGTGEIGNQTVTYTYTDPISGLVTTATATVHVAGIWAEIEAGNQGVLNATPDQVAYGSIYVENAVGLEGGNYTVTGTLTDKTTGQKVTIGTANFTIDSLGNAQAIVQYNFDGTGHGGHTVYGIYTFGATDGAATGDESVMNGPVMAAAMIPTVMDKGLPVVNAANEPIPPTSDSGLPVNPSESQAPSESEAPAIPSASDSGLPVNPSESETPAIPSTSDSGLHVLPSESQAPAKPAPAKPAPALPDTGDSDASALLAAEGAGIALLAMATTMVALKKKRRA